MTLLVQFVTLRLCDSEKPREGVRKGNVNTIRARFKVQKWQICLRRKEKIHGAFNNFIFEGSILQKIYICLFWPFNTENLKNQNCPYS